MVFRPFENNVNEAYVCIMWNGWLSKSLNYKFMIVSGDTTSSSLCYISNPDIHFFWNISNTQFWIARKWVLCWTYGVTSFQKVFLESHRTLPYTAWCSGVTTHRLVYCSIGTGGANFTCVIILPTAMAHVPPKRSFVDIADLHKLGASNKRARINATTSKLILDTEDAHKLLSIDRDIASMDKLMEGVRQTRSLVQATLDDLRFSPLAILDDQTLVDLCQDGLAECEKINADSTASNIITTLQRLMTHYMGTAASLSVQEDRSLTRRIAYYQSCPLELPEVNALRNAKRVDMIEDEMDEAQEAVYTATFNKAEEALDEVQGITEGKPLTHADIGRFTHFLHERGHRQRDGIGQLVVSATKFYDDILCGEYKKHISRVECVVCLDECVAAAKCSDNACGGGMCVECFVHRMQSYNNSGWVSAWKIVDVLCASCESPLDKRLLQLLPQSAMAMYLKAVGEHTTTAANKHRAEVEQNKEHKRYAAYRTENLSFKEKLYNLERQVTITSGDMNYLL